MVPKSGCPVTGQSAVYSGHSWRITSENVRTPRPHEDLVDHRRNTASGRRSATAARAAAKPYGNDIASRIAETCAQVAAVPDLVVACGQLLPLLVEASGATRASIMLINPDTGRLVIANAFGVPVDLTGQDLPYRTRSISEWVVENQRPVILNGDIKEERFEGCDCTIE